MYRIVMDVPFNPKEVLLKVLGPSPSHPWAALIPQVILWSFQRFCLEKITLFEGGLEESFSDDVLELVHRYCPKGLEVVSISWLTPENIEEVSSSMEDYMRFCIDYCRVLDTSIEENDYDWQDELSEFLDEEMGTMIRGWLDDRHRNLLIFPVEFDTNEFTEEQFGTLINAMLNYSYKCNTALAVPAVPAVPVVPAVPAVPVVPAVPAVPAFPAVPAVPAVPALPKKRLSLWELLSISKNKPPPQEPLPQEPLPQEPLPQEPPPQEPQEIVPEQPTHTTPIAKALARRRTLCKHGRRSEESRVKTRKLNRASY